METDQLKNAGAKSSWSDLARETACETLRIEQEALTALQTSINDDFIASVGLILGLKGRLVVCGIGKSALVGQKIVATLNSTGTLALFMHAADAIHGDLGMITPEDAVLCLSKSGNTPEIKVILPLIKTRCKAVIGMTADADSALAKQSHYVLLTPIEKEADPNNLAPTTSTTSQMALGDALSMALLACRGFSAADFAKVHPGGALGKQLYLRVSDLAGLHGRPQVQTDATLTDVIEQITRHRAGATAVLDSQNELIGIITDGDLRRAFQHPDAFTSLKAIDCASRNPKTIETSALAVEAMAIMRQHSISQLVALDDQHRYAGIIHLHDLLREGIV
jgi:arabinose-5-phosphate isomerase